MKWFLALVVLAFVGLAGWYYYCPNPVIDQFQAAVDSGKPEAILPFMDMPSLKKKVSDFVRLKYHNPDNPSADMSGEALQEIVDAYVTPDNVLRFMRGGIYQPGQAAPPPPDDKAAPSSIEKHYESLDVFAIDIYLTPVKTPDNKFSLLFERDGWFGWKLAAFRFSWS